MPAEPRKIKRDHCQAGGAIEENNSLQVAEGGDQDNSGVLISKWKRYKYRGGEGKGK